MAKNKKGQIQGKSQEESKNSKSQSKKESKSNSKSVILAAVIIILLLAGIGFLIIGLAQSFQDGDGADQDTVQTDDDGDREDRDSDDNDDSGSEERRGEDDDDRDSASSEDESDTRDTSDTDSGRADSATGIRGDMVVATTDIETVSMLSNDVRGDFQATNDTYSFGNTYRFGDIDGDTHTTVAGDTLWQIAQGKYGSGFAWVEIDSANGGFPLLPDGTPVNIPIGFELLLPSL